MTNKTNEEILNALREAWSASSSTKWKKENPALGQCGVTALVVQDWLGGEILKTKIKKPGQPELWHFYNRVGGEAVDFTASQFDELVEYNNINSTRHEALLDTNNEQYAHLG